MLNVIRDTLLALESELLLDVPMSLETVSQISSLQKYDSQDIEQAIFKLAEIGYLNYDGDVTSVLDITWNGHMFLDNCRSEKVWEYVISNSNGLRDANHVAEGYIRTLLNLN
ncbi:DUF2513 domain-containing protein [Paenibacillus brevis]|uniref:DUF2513 domain-containing protein n=1 Tax=Paenibacillus brevis TaxID=2841508 RepID=A0ABS6FT25_9BACL|nr:DUF2513 domain-containing protein [Paenibacillus brevis]MBU5673259.1 DUF2513 domain-containing protein [Paenibacillus brevis]